MEVRGIKGSGVAALAASIAIFAVAAPTAGATSFSVTGTADGSPACTAGSCPTLRSAIAAVNTDGGTNTITLPAGTFTLTSDELKITNGDKLTLQGAGAGQTIIDGGGTHRILELTGLGASLSVTGVTLQHGKTSGEDSGGAIEDSGTGDHLTVDKSTLDQNSAGGDGGSIDAPRAANITVTDSTISNSTAAGNGGGIDAANLVMSGSTVNGNVSTGGNGGGVYLSAPVDICVYWPWICGGGEAGVRAAPVQVQNPNPSIVNSTIVGNSTGDNEGDGGGIAIAPNFEGLAPVKRAKGAQAAQLQPPNISGLVSLISDTIVGNTSTNGGGGNVSQWYFTSLWIQGSIIGGGEANGKPNNCTMNYWGMDGGSNLVFSKKAPADKCFGNPASNDILPGDAKLTNGPGLDADASGNLLLADNGGPTKTIALLPGSPAIDAVTDLAQQEVAPVSGSTAIAAQPSCSDLLGLPLTVDQRGAQRPDIAATGCDIGAFESGAAPLVLTGSVTPNPGAIGKPLSYSFTATNNGPSFGTQSKFDATLPPGVTFDSATPSQGSCTQPTATTVDCTLGVIPDGTASVTIAVTPNSSGTYAVTGTASDRESGASAPLTLSANVNGTTTTVPSKVAPKPSTQVRACVSRRNFPIHIQHLRRLHIASATVYVNGLAVRTVRGKHLTAPIDLRQLPKGTFTITIVAHQRNGHALRGKRTYHTCSVKLSGHKHLSL
jgi:uncharacterized repeat protein (TIGR01451 family)